MSISSHYQQLRSKGWCSFSMRSDSSLSSPCKDLYPHWLVVGHMSWVILARHISLQGLCHTSAGSAARWLTSPFHLVLSDAPGRGCTQREVAGFPQPLLNHSALPREVQESRGEVIACCWRPEWSLQCCLPAVQWFLGVSLAVSTKRRNSL